MPLSAAQLDAYFTYHAPTEEQKPKYANITSARDACATKLAGAFVSYQSTGKNATYFDVVNKATREFAEVIDANAPVSADTTAAIRCVRLARNAANQALTEPVNSLVVFAAIVDAELFKAQWQANSAIALEGKV
jgi:hypothetical protein